MKLILTLSGGFNLFVLLLAIQTGIQIVEAAARMGVFLIFFVLFKKFKVV